MSIPSQAASNDQHRRAAREQPDRPASDPGLRALHDLPDHGRLRRPGDGLRRARPSSRTGESRARARAGVRRRQLRRAARLARLQHGRRQDRPPAGPHRRHVLLLGHGHRHRYAQNVQQLLWLRFIAGIGIGCIMPNATALDRRVQPEAQPRHADDVHHRRLHRRRGARRIRRRLADPGFRLAVGVHLRRRGSVGDRAGDGLGPARVAAVPGGQRTRPRPRWRAGSNSSTRRFASTRPRSSSPTRRAERACRSCTCSATDAAS